MNTQTTHTTTGYEVGYQAHLGLTGDRICVVPDEVALNQMEWDGRTFIAIVPAGWRGTGTRQARKMRVRLVGTDYGLHTTGTGDMVVRPVRWVK